jgi:hypothetical protein
MWLIQKMHTLKAGVVAMAAVLALSASVMWTSPAWAQDDPTTANQVTLRSIHASVRQARTEAAAEVLGMTPDEVEAALADGETFATLAEQQGVPTDAVREAATTAAKEARENGARELVAQLLANGRISQERADWILEGIDNGWFEGFSHLPSRFLVLAAREHCCQHQN